jgi:hypothetical protein
MRAPQCGPQKPSEIRTSEMAAPEDNKPAAS